MKKNRMTHTLLAGTGVSENDAARLTLEAIETMGRIDHGRAVPLRGVRGIRKRDRHIPRNRKRKWQTLRRAAGFRHWVPDVCRHSFATYHAAMFRNLPELQLEMGHRDTSLLRSRYMVPASRKDAELFWKGSR